LVIKAAPKGSHLLKWVYQLSIAACINLHPLVTYAAEGLIAETDATGTLTTTYGWQPDGIGGSDPVFKRDYTSPGASST